MRAVFIIKHPEVSLVGSPAEGLVHALAGTCGNRINDHSQALRETWAFRDAVIELSASVVYAFRPTMFAIAICSRSSPTQFDIHIESSQADIWSVSAKVIDLVSKILPSGRITYDVTLQEDDGKETGIRGKNVRFVNLLIEQGHELRIVPLLLTVSGGFLAAFLFKRDALTGATSGAVGLAMLVFFILISCVYQAIRGSRNIKWKFEENR